VAAWRHVLDSFIITIKKTSFMISTNKNISIALLFLAIALICHAGIKKDTTAPILSITSPTDGSAYHTNDSMHIIGSTTDESLHELQIKITNDSTSAIMYLDTPEVQGDLTSFAINSNWKAMLLQTSMPRSPLR
jgi:hypothetical protein